jgi:hypothetical protein
MQDTNYTESDWQRDDRAQDSYDSAELERMREYEADDLREQEREIELMTSAEREGR